jgi:hypothetical protein
VLRDVAVGLGVFKCSRASCRETNLLNRLVRSDNGKASLHDGEAAKSLEWEGCF